MLFLNRFKTINIPAILKSLAPWVMILTMSGCATYAPVTQQPNNPTPTILTQPDFRPGRPQTAESTTPRPATSERQNPPNSQTDNTRASSYPSIATNKRAQAINAIYEKAVSAFEEQHWDQAIKLAERGLRMQRQYAPFYWLLAESYQAKGNQNQAQSFARQGLNYADKRAGFHSRLLYLSQPN